MKRNIFGMVLAAAVFLFLLLLPTPDGLTVEGKRALALLIAGIILWVTEALPGSMTALLLMVLMPYLKIMPTGDVWAKFISPVIFFVIGVFGITIVLTKSNIPNRIAAMVLKWAGNSSKRLLFGFTMAAGFVSTMISDLTTCVIFMGLGLTVLQLAGEEPGKSPLGKALMILIPYGSVVGGIVTPSGTSLNMMALNILQEATGQKITFAAWMMVGTPIAIGLLLMAYTVVYFIFRPQDISEEASARIADFARNVQPLTGTDIKSAVVIGGMFGLWLLSSWVPQIDIIAVAVAGLVFMFFPGINLLTKKEFMEKCSWDTVLMIGGVQSVAAGLTVTGAGAWIINTLMSGCGSWSPLMIVLVASVVGAVLHILIPVGTAALILMLPPLIGIASATGVNPAIMALLAAYWSAIIYFLPIDVIPIVTYSTGYYKMTDMMKPGSILTILAILFITLAIIPLATLANLGG